MSLQGVRAGRGPKLAIREEGNYVNLFGLMLRQITTVVYEYIPLVCGVYFPGLLKHTDISLLPLSHYCAYFGLARSPLHSGRTLFEITCSCISVAGVAAKLVTHLIFRDVDPPNKSEVRSRKKMIWHCDILANPFYVRDINIHVCTTLPATQQLET